jgi:hypothetical protein
MGTHTIFLSHCAIDELKAPAYAEAPAGRPAYAKASAGKPGYYAKASVYRQSSKKDCNACLVGKVRCRAHSRR